MKHKAQEALNELNDYNDTLQQLIDNQLTVEEVNIMKLWAWEAMAYAECAGNENKAIMYNNLRNKLIYQREMWEVE